MMAAPVGDRRDNEGSTNRTKVVRWAKTEGASKVAMESKTKVPAKKERRRKG